MRSKRPVRALIGAVVSLVLLLPALAAAQHPPYPGGTHTPAPSPHHAYYQVADTSGAGGIDASLIAAGLLLVVFAARVVMLTTREKRR